MMEVLSNPGNLSIDIQLLKSPLFEKHSVSVYMLRLDAIHPIVSGNKIFKLRYFLEEAKNSSHKKIITFGGAYSNHLAATAYACKSAGLKSTGFIRGEKPKQLSHTLRFCLENEMQLEFISRDLYKEINEEEFQPELIKKYGNHILIPEGGFSQKGVEGAKLICSYFNHKKFTHVCCAVGTATTFSGLIHGSNNKMENIGFSVLKNLHDIDERLTLLQVPSSKKYSVVHDYHFGGYAKKNNELISFMNSFYESNKIPLDFVYTSKMMFGIYDLIEKNYFPAGSKILCIHTGGLQGNKSLSERMLNF